MRREIQNANGPNQLARVNPHLAPRTSSSALLSRGMTKGKRLPTNVNVLTFQQDGSRPITALDDILRALLFACQLIEDDANKQRDKGTTSSSIAGKENKNKEKNSKPGLELSRVVWGLEWTGQCDVWPGLMC